MNAAPTSLQTEQADKGDDAEDQTLALVMEQRRRRRRIVLIVAVVGMAAASIAIAVDGGHNGKPKNTTPTVPTGLVTVTKGTLTARTSVSGTLSYAGSYKAVNQATGPFTHLPKTGQVINQCRVLYMVNGQPVMFFKGGSTPMYRDLKEKMTGPDVKEINAGLVACGFVSSGYLSSNSSTYTWATTAGVKNMQKYLELKQTGKLGKGDVVFLGATKIRITSVTAQLGAAAQPGGPVLEGSSTDRQVNVDVDAALQTKIKAGEKVTITLPTGDSTDGVVSSVGTVVKKAANGSSTVNVRIKPKDSKATGNLDQAPVGVSIVTESVKDATTVPVNALLALLGGGYGIEVVDPSGVHRIVTVQLGLFDDTAGTVQITGKDVQVGQKVVVPGS